MRCSPGDLAIVKSERCPQLNGQIVEVLSRTPSGKFRLPDGGLHMPTSYEWVIKPVGLSVTLPLHRGGSAKSKYTTAPDWALFPLRGKFDFKEEAESVVCT